MGGELVCFVWSLVVLHYHFEECIHLLLGQDDVFQLDHFRRDDGEDGVEVVVQQFGEVMCDHLHHAVQALLDGPERFQVLQRVLLRQFGHEGYQFLQ